MHNSPVIRIGFDLDGVLLYNPIRIIRPIVSWIKRKLLQKRQTKFFVPKGRFLETLFILFHKTSLFIAAGYDQIFALSKLPTIEIYLITARFSFLRRDLEEWEEKLQAKKVFKKIYYNEFDEQPHIFKQRMLEELQLSIFVEDNWDIVSYLHTHCPKTKVAWIYNILDTNIRYALKFSDLRKVMDWINKELSKS